MFETTLSSDWRRANYDAERNKTSEQVANDSKYEILPFGFDNATVAPTRGGWWGDEQVMSVRVICEVWLSMPIAIVGIIGNVLSLIVLCSRDQRRRLTQASSAVLVLLSLAVVDTAVLIYFLLMRSFRSLLWPTEIYRYAFVGLFPTAYILRLVQTWLTVLLTVDRHIAVCHPLHAQRLSSVHRTSITIGCLVGCGVLFNLPRFFEYKLTEITADKPTGFTATELLSDPVYTTVYRIILFFIVNYLTPMILLTVLNIWLLRALRDSQAYQASTVVHFRRPAPAAETGNQSAGRLDVTTTSSGTDGNGIRRSSSGGASGERVDLRKTNGRSSSSNSTANRHNPTRSITVITVAVVIITVVCNISSIVSHLVYALELSVPNWTARLEYHRRHLSNFNNVFITINSAANFFVYFAFSRRFRRGVASLFGCDRWTWEESTDGSVSVRASRGQVDSTRRLQWRLTAGTCCPSTGSRRITRRSRKSMDETLQTAIGNGDSGFESNNLIMTSPSKWKPPQQRGSSPTISMTRFSATSDNRRPLQQQLVTLNNKSSAVSSCAANCQQRNPEAISWRLSSADNVDDGSKPAS